MKRSADRSMEIPGSLANSVEPAHLGSHPLPADILGRKTRTLSISNRTDEARSKDARQLHRQQDSKGYRSDGLSITKVHCEGIHRCGTLVGRWVVCTGGTLGFVNGVPMADLQSANCLSTIVFH